VMYESSRKLILKGADGIVFVADSQKERNDANVKSIESLKIYLEEYGYRIEKIPFVFQYNKRDLSNVMTVAELSGSVNSYARPEFEATAVNGSGVFDTLKKITKLVLDELKGGST
ncbi:MAG: GTPase domain-containing protein, partial [Oligoflexia bacterium]|nr:GTPase domain-containing protein [Oligoflexia bacterium]